VSNVPRRSTFKHHSVNEPKKQALNISKYKGVDYSTTKLNVSDDHAIEIKNIIYKDNVNQKRDGWEQILKIEPIKYYVLVNGIYEERTNTTNVNGIWTFIGENNVKHTVAHIGKLLFEIKGLGEGKSFLYIKANPITKNITVDKKTYNVAQELNDEPTQAFCGAKRLYILGGNKYFVLRSFNGLDYMAVEDDVDTYIPTTTIGITYKDSSVNLAAPLDDVNLMTQYRKNKLISGTYLDDGVALRTTRFWDYELDTSVTPKNQTDINNITINIKELREVE
jgi:hypothetical protein